MESKDPVGGPTSRLPGPILTPTIPDSGTSLHPLPAGTGCDAPSGDGRRGAWGRPGAHRSLHRPPAMRSVPRARRRGKNGTLPHLPRLGEASTAFRELLPPERLHHGLRCMQRDRGRLRQSLLRLSG